MSHSRSDLDRSLERLSLALSGQPEAAVLDALRDDPELATWGWTDVRLSTWARQIAANGHAVYDARAADLD